MNRRGFLRLAAIAPVAAAATVGTTVSASAPQPTGYAIEIDPMIARTNPEILVENGRPRQFKIEPGQAVIVPGRVVPMYLTGKVVSTDETARS